MTDTYHEEGDKCPECEGHLNWPPTKECSCHIAPPCSACVDRVLTCSVCGWEDDELPVLDDEESEEVELPELDLEMEFEDKG